jgi:hypothetical protein
VVCKLRRSHGGRSVFLFRIESQQRLEDRSNKQCSKPLLVDDYAALYYTQYIWDCYHPLWDVFIINQYNEIAADYEHCEIQCVSSLSQ